LLKQISKQQRMDAEAAAKFMSAMGVNVGGGSGSGNQALSNSALATAAALQAAHQQMLRMPSAGQSPQLPAHLLQFSPLLYPYQMAMAQV
jgi:hypothetical protein